MSHIMPNIVTTLPLSVKYEASVGKVTGLAGVNSVIVGLKSSVKRFRGSSVSQETSFNILGRPI